MPIEEYSLLDRWSLGLLALLDAGLCSEKIAASLLELVPGASSAECRLDGSTGSAGKARANSVVVSAEVEAAGQRRGQLSVRMPAKKAGFSSVLSLAARLVGLQLLATADDHRHLMDLVTVGEGACNLVHAINNHLNSVVLQAACIQMQTQPPISEQAENIRREAARTAARMRPLQAVHPWQSQQGVHADLVAALRQALRDEPELAGLEAQLPDDEILLSASPMGLRRLLTLLLRVSRRCTDNKQMPRLRLTHDDGVKLSIELPGVACDAEQEGLHLPPEYEGGVHQIEREAVRWLVNQSGGRIDVTPGPEGAIITVLWDDTLVK